jgi:peptidoglycan hydrolase CwlO-like protein
MKKLLIIGMIGAVALVAIVKKTNVCSYAGTLFAQVEKDARDQVPTKFELERIRNEISALDGDISQMIRPIAEYKTVIEKMRKDIDKSQKNIDEQKKVLLTVVEDLKGEPSTLRYGDKVYSVERVRNQLHKDTERLKQLEKHVKVQHQVLEAKEQSLKATQEQLAKVISKKREYEVRLSQLEAEEETLKIAKLGSGDIKLDSTRATEIENALTRIEERQNVERHTLELKAAELANIPLGERNRTPSDINAIRSYLEGSEQADKTAANNK